MVGLRELLEPDDDRAIAVSPDDELIRDLTAPRWRWASIGRIRAE
jgi:hypothetical protein